jgi:hypothetical protein
MYWKRMNIYAAFKECNHDMQRFLQRYTKDTSRYTIREIEQRIREEKKQKTLSSTATD